MMILLPYEPRVLCGTNDGLFIQLTVSSWAEGRSLLEVKMLFLYENSDDYRVL